MSGIGQEFLEKTKYRNLGRSGQQEGRPQPPLEKPLEPNAEVVDLPDPAATDARQVELTQAIQCRRSVRKYSDQPLTLRELSHLLWCTQGVKEVMGDRATLRTVPSAGARHPFETYLLINRVEGLEPGVYRYLALEQKLARCDFGGAVAGKIHDASLRQYALASAVTFIWVAVAARSTWRYAERAYRYLFLDAGHVGQNLYLACEAIGAGCCAIAAFDDDGMNQALGLDGRGEFVIYMATVGKR